MSMSRKDYEDVAAVLKPRTGDNDHDRAIIAEIARGLATAFASRNPHFDRQRFIFAATGLLEES